MQMRTPQMLTILQPHLSQREVVKGPRKNMIPVARDPTHAVDKKGGTSNK